MRDAGKAEFFLCRLSKARFLFVGAPTLTRRVLNITPLRGFEFPKKRKIARSGYLPYRITPSSRRQKRLGQEWQNIGPDMVLPDTKHGRISLRKLCLIRRGGSRKSGHREVRLHYVLKLFELRERAEHETKGFGDAAYLKGPSINRVSDERG